MYPCLNRVDFARKQCGGSTAGTSEQWSKGRKKEGSKGERRKGGREEGGREVGSNRAREQGRG